jgi:hypothetical protein
LSTSACKRAPVGRGKNRTCNQIGPYAGGRSTRWNACDSSRRELSTLHRQSRWLKSGCQSVCESACVRIAAGRCGVSTRYAQDCIGGATPAREPRPGSGRSGRHLWHRR